MPRLLQVVYYICHLARLSGVSLPKARLVKLVYLADWKSSVDRGCQITEVEWLYNHYGPYVKEIVDIIDSNPDFVRRNYINQFGNPAEKIDLRDGVSQIELLNIDLNDQERNIIEFVSSITKDMSYTEFLRLVYSTYPIIKGEKFQYLDLVKMSKDYISFKQNRNEFK